MVEILSNKILLENERQEVAKTALELLKTRLIVNTSGNASQRIGDLVAITPSARDYNSLTASDICVVDLNGEMVDGKWLPSSELQLHLALYNANPDCKAVVHTHSVNATAASMLVNKLPAIHYQMSDLGGSVPVAPYATFGSMALVDSVIKTIPGYSAVLMANHGSISYGPNLSKALSRSVLLEWCAEVWMKAKMVGEPKLLSETQLKDAMAQMQHYATSRAKCSCQ